MLKWKKPNPAFFAVLSVVSALAISAGCGQAPDPSVPSVGTTPTGTTGTTTGTTSGGPTPNYDFHFQIDGHGAAYKQGGGTLSVATDTTLQVSISAGNGVPYEGTGYSIGFNCLWLTVKVGNVAVPAFVKKQYYSDVALSFAGADPCAGAQTNWTYDFSSALSPGHGPMSVQITGAEYDNCRLFNDPYDGGCSQSAVYPSHSVDGFLQVFTD